LFIERDGGRLFSTTLGTGPDVVLLHPTPVHHAFWLPVAERLASDFRVTLVDLRGHGQSTSGAGPITMGRLAEDLHAVLQSMEVIQAALVGCSIGGYLLYEYWRRFPGEVAGLVPVCGKPQADTATNREKRNETMRTARQPNGLGRIFDLMTDTLIAPTAQQRNPELRKIARAMMNDVSLDAFLAVQEGLMERPDSVPTLATVRVPVCVVAGGEDQVSSPDEMRVIAEEVQGTEFHLLPDAGHYAPLEQPEKIACILQAFFKRVASQSSATPAAKSNSQKSTTGPVH